MEEEPEIQRGRDERARQRSEERQRQAAASEAKKSPRDPEKQHYFAAATTPIGVLGSGERLFYLLVLGVLGTIVVYAGLGVMLHVSPETPLATSQDVVLYYVSRLWPLLIAYPIAGLGLFMIGRAAGARAARRELAWLAGLPFPVEGELDAFSHGTWHRERSVTLSFATQPMPREELARLLDAFSAGASVNASSDELEFKVTHTGRIGFFSGLFETRAGTSSTLPGRQYTSNRALLLLFHDLVAGVLLPLHRAHPVTEVKLDS